MTKSKTKSEEDSPAAPAGSPHFASLVSSAPALIPLACTAWADLCFITAASAGKAIVSGSPYVFYLCRQRMQKTPTCFVSPCLLTATNAGGASLTRNAHTHHICYEAWEAFLFPRETERRDETVTVRRRDDTESTLSRGAASFVGQVGFLVHAHTQQVFGRGRLPPGPPPRFL